MPGLGGLIAMGLKPTGNLVSRAGEEGTRDPISSMLLLLIEGSHTVFHMIDSDEIVHYHAGGAAYVHTID